MVKPRRHRINKKSITAKNRPIHTSMAFWGFDISECRHPFIQNLFHPPPQRQWRSGECTASKCAQSLPPCDKISNASPTYSSVTTNTALSGNISAKGPATTERLTRNFTRPSEFSWAMA
eukprot:RCo006721